MPYVSRTYRRKYAVRRLAYRKNYRRTTRVTRRFRPTRRYRKVALHRSLWQNPLPLKASYKLRYQDSAFTLTADGVTGQASYVFRGNSCHDPDLTGVGVQPYAFDQLCASGAQFGYYCVHASKIRIIPFFPNGGMINCRLAVFPSRVNPVTFTEFEDVTQIPGCRYIAIKDGGNTDKKLVSYTSTRRVFGKPDVDNDFTAAYNASPSSQWYWCVLFDTNDNNHAATVLRFDVRITYYVTLSRGDDVNES